MKKTILVLSILFIGAISGYCIGCANVKADDKIANLGLYEETSWQSIKDGSINNWIQTYTFKDKQTNKEYIIIKGQDAGGRVSIAVTPRLGVGN